MKVISSVVVAFVIALSLNVSANAQGVEIYGIGSSNFDIPCDVECPPCPDGEFCICLCPDETLVTNEIDQFLGESAFYKISPSTGDREFIGYTGFAGCRGLDIHPLTGEFYAVCHRFIGHGGPPGMFLANNNAEEGGQFLVQIDENTGEGTEIGSLGDGIGYLRGVFVSDISFYTDGTLYAHLHANDIKEANPAASTSNGATDNMLGTIDLTTGLFSPIGPTNSDDFLSAIGFSIFGDLIQCANNEDFMNKEAVDETTNFIGGYFTNINSLNINTGNATFLRQANFPPDVDGHFNIITSKDVDEETGDFYAFLKTEFDNWIFDADTKNIASGSYLVRINPENGDVELIGQTSPPFEDFLAIAVAKGKVRAVPTMSEYGLMLTVALFVGAAVVFLRRRQAKSEV